MTIEEAFGAVIRRLRRDCTLSQEKLALDSGIDRSFLSNIEGGKQQPSLVTVFSIANALNIIPSKIIQEVELLLNCCHPDLFKSESSRWDFDWVSKISQVTNNYNNDFNGTETILIADDEELIRNMLSSFLTNYGYNVILANDGVDACNKYKERVGNIALVIMDIVMPKMNGKDVLVEIKSINPKSKIIMTSGYRANDMKFIDNDSIIYKPFSPLDILKVVRTTLDSTS